MYPTTRPENCWMRTPQTRSLGRVYMVYKRSSAGPWCLQPVKHKLSCAPLAWAFAFCLGTGRGSPSPPSSGFGPPFSPVPESSVLELVEESDVDFASWPAACVKLGSCAESTEPAAVTSTSAVTFAAGEACRTVQDAGTDCGMHGIRKRNGRVDE